MRLAAAAPLAALAPALADSNNEYLGYKYPEGIGKGNFDTRGLKGDGVGSEPGKFNDETGAAVPPTAKFTAKQYSTNAPPRAKAQVRIAGVYTDPMHPGCTRKVTLIGTNKVLVEGADEDKKAYKLKGTYEGKTVVIDFSPKGGPKDVTATYSIAKGLTFADGNVWSKSGSNRQ